MITHEKIMCDLKNLLRQNLPGFQTISRRFRLIENCSGQMPALLIVEPSEQRINTIEGLPEQKAFDVDLYVYVDVGLDPEIEPISALNALIEQVAAAFAPTLPLPFDQVCTLGGLVQHCWIEGTIEKSPGDLDGLGMARIPLKISIP